MRRKPRRRSRGGAILKRRTTPRSIRPTAPRPTVDRLRPPRSTRGRRAGRRRPTNRNARAGERARGMTSTIRLQDAGRDITIHPVVEQQAPFFDVLEFFPGLTRELLEENRSWLQPDCIDPATGRLVLCVQSFVVKTPHHNILIDSCVGNHKPRPSRPFWNMMNDDRYEKNLAATGLGVEDIDYVMCTHLHVDHVGWNTRLDNVRWVPTFPKARYVFAKGEYDYWTEQHAKAEVPPFGDSVLPIVEAKKAEIVGHDFSIGDHV